MILNVYRFKLLSLWKFVVAATVKLTHQVSPPWELGKISFHLCLSGTPSEAVV